MGGVEAGLEACPAGLETGATDGTAGGDGADPDSDGHPAHGSTTGEQCHGHGEWIRSQFQSDRSPLQSRI
jgi:hypothetical protein